MSNLSCDLSRNLKRRVNTNGVLVLDFRTFVRYYSCATTRSSKSVFRFQDSGGHRLPIVHNSWTEDEQIGLTWCVEQLGAEMLLTINQVATQHLQVSRATVYRLIRDGELASVKVRGCTRVALSEVSLYEASIGAST
jgi:excisionase family DNA binding protein